MRFVVLSLVVASITGCITVAGGGDGALRATYLRTEYRIDPLGIDVRAPRLSWVLESGRRGESQTAYQVLVASRPELLEEGKPDLWDSGRTAGDDPTAVVYAGQPLRSHQLCFWQVRSWGRDRNKPSAWSAPSRWSMGFLDGSPWQAAWIGHDAPAAKTAAPAARALDGAHWIWHAEGDPGRSAPVATRYFRRVVALPAGPAVRAAELFVAADNHAVIHVNGVEVGRNDNLGAATKLDVGTQLRAGKNVIAIAARNAGDAPNPAGLLAALSVSLEGAAPLEVMSDGAWRSADALAAGWSAVDFDDAKWPVAKDLGPNGTPPWPKVAAPAPLRLPPPRYLRGEVEISKPVARATLYCSALGIYEARLNGRKVGDDWFTPGWTDYDRRVYYNTYDVTGIVVPGRNALGAVLADGWYAGYLGFGGGRDHYGDHISFLAELRVEHPDGTTTVLATSPEWRGATGPLLEADFLMGEAHDARREISGWDRAGFDDSGWARVDVSPQVKGRVEAYPGVTVKELAPIASVAMTEPAPGRFVFDLGQNFAGVVRLTLRGAKAGQEIALRHAEMLNPDGTIYTTNLRSARATDRFISAGAAEETWHPRFTFHGFRYVELTGYPGKPPADAVIGIPLSSDTPLAGSLETSNALINQLLSNIYWTQRMNFIDIPTDCPQRDERLGWTGDAQVYMRTACLLTDTQAFFTKWLVDLYDAQREDGQFPMVAPLKSKGVSADGGPAWADAGVICPWTAYEVYGDRRILERHYEGMKRFVAFCKLRCSPGLLPPAKFHCFGDWLSINADTPTDVILLAYFAYSTMLTARAADALGKARDARELRELYERTRAAFNRAFVASDGTIKGDTQAAYVLALQFDLVDGVKGDQAARRLVADIEKRGGHLSTGFVGTKDLMLVLSKIGREDVAFRLLLNESFPSWGFSLRHGATTIWERWNGWTPEQGFGDPGMNSFAHYAFGAVAQWIFENVGGIRSLEPGYRRIAIRPRRGGGLTHARTSHRSIRGEVATHWRVDGSTFHLDVTVPVGATALVHVPTSSAGDVTEGGRAPAASIGVKLVGSAADEVVFEVGSGRYSFAAPIKAIKG